MKKFNEIRSRNELADFLGIARSRLSYVLYIKRTDNYYKQFEIAKKGGGTRHICASFGSLKDIQKRIAYALWEHELGEFGASTRKANISHAFEKDKSIITNARIHRGKRVVIGLDLVDFFGSFHFGRVMGFFEKNRHFALPHEVAVVLAQLVCFDGRLPQGAPSSPIITNLVCKILDMRLLSIAREHRVDYTRYADDLTFSTNSKEFVEKVPDFIGKVTREIEGCGFIVSPKKTRIMMRSNRQEVTGLVVNEKLAVPSSYYKLTRAMAYNQYKNGEFFLDGQKGSLASLEGRFSFIDQLRRQGCTTGGNKFSANRLSGREAQFGAFLFYRYFYAAELPVIVTEGKTDVRYIKAALKNKYKEYPQLVEKTGANKFRFKVKFLHRSERLQYFLGIGQDGADPLSVIYKYYNNSGYKAYPEYFKKFLEISGVLPPKPVLLLYDNEMAISGKPLNKFLNGKMDLADRAEFAKKLYYRIVGRSNLYVITNPLVNGLKECEIEDLFDKKTLSHQIQGRTFTREPKYNIKVHYGKEIFSKYIHRNYLSVDFSSFSLLLNGIADAIQDYGQGES